MELLLVDDNAGESYLFLYALRALGHAVNFHHAKDGVEALQILGENTVDLVVLDLNLPGISGYEVLRQCNPTHVPVVVFSLSSSEDDARRALRLGAREFVHKPSTIDEYRDSVVKMVGKWANHPV